MVTIGRQALVPPENLLDLCGIIDRMSIAEAKSKEMGWYWQ
jgi:hypothetical protein